MNLGFNPFGRLSIDWIYASAVSMTLRGSADLAVVDTGTGGSVAISAGLV
jgi:hypothetical protein